MHKHSFFKYSFFILLMVNSAYTLGLIFAGAAAFNIESAQASLVWFVTFFWLPVWAAAIVIFKLREHGIHKTLPEWLIAVTFMGLGNTVTDQALAIIFEGYQKMGLFIIFNGLLWGTMIYFISLYIESKKKVSIEKHSRKQAQLATLRYQLNPHFMFNSLNTISAYIHSNPDLADEVLHDLADILRYSLDTAEQQKIPLQQELDIIEKYLHIEQARFGEKLQVNYDIPAALKHIHVPPLLLQPIIENAIKHNVNQKNLIINIQLSEIKSGIRITISDNGKGFSQNVLEQGFGAGIGMKNIQQRVNQLDNGHVAIQNANGAQVLVEMAL